METLLTSMPEVALIGCGIAVLAGFTQYFGRLASRRAREAEEAIRGQQALKDTLEERTRTLADHSAELEDNERRLTTIMNNLQGMAFRCANDRDWTMEFMSRGCVSLTGYQPSDLVGNQLLSFGDLIHAEDGDRVHDAVQAAVDAREPWKIDYRIRKRDGEEVWVWDHGFPVFSKDGQMEALEGFIHDITLQKQAELALEAYAAELKRSNEELDDFAYIASHDLKEPLRGIGSYAAFLLEDYGEHLDDEGRAKLDTLTHLAKRMESIINALLYYSRLGRLDMARQETDLNEIVAEVLDSVRITLDEQRVDVRLPGPLPTIVCDQARIGEVFRNFVTNALKYNDKLEKWIEIGCNSADEPTPVFLCSRQWHWHPGKAHRLDFPDFQTTARTRQVWRGRGRGAHLRQENSRASWRSSVGGINLRRGNDVLFHHRGHERCSTRQTSRLMGFRVTSCWLKTARWTTTS